MSIRGRWRVVETPNYDMAAAGAYILFDEDGGEFAFDWQGNGSRLHREALPYFFNSLLGCVSSVWVEGDANNECCIRKFGRSL